MLVKRNTAGEKLTNATKGHILSLFFVQRLVKLIAIFVKRHTFKAIPLYPALHFIFLNTFEKISFINKDIIAIKKCKHVVFSNGKISFFELLGGNIAAWQNALTRDAASDARNATRVK